MILSNPKSFEPPRLESVTVNGTSLPVLHCGQGEPVILIHGTLGDFRSWSEQLGPLAKRYRVISYSRRHHYPQSKLTVTGSYRPADHVMDLFTLIETLDIAPVHLIGRGYGAAICILAAEQRPALMRSLVLGEPELFSLLTDINDRVAFNFQRIALNVVRMLIDTDELDEAVHEYLRITYGREILREMSSEAQSMIRDNAHTLGPALTTVLETMEFDHACARSMQLPTLVVQGERSPRLNRAICQELNRVLPDSRLVTLTGASHGLHLEQPVEFNQVALDFLSDART